MSSDFSREFSGAFRRWWRQQADSTGFGGAAALLARNLWDFARESTPERRRQRYGDMEYDWDHRVNTTSGTIDWRTRLLGLFHSPYQPTDPALFHQMMASLPIAFDSFTFIDLGSGKGRTLLMASEYPFTKVIGVEILRDLHRAARENIGAYRSPTQRCREIVAMHADAREIELPAEPLVLYLFNPLPQRALEEVIARLEKSVAEHPRQVWVIYHNPLLDRVLSASHCLEPAGGTNQYSLYRTAGSTHTGWCPGKFMAV